VGLEIASDVAAHSRGVLWLERCETGVIVGAQQRLVLKRRVNWVLDADIRDCFTGLDQSWLAKFLEHRIADKRVLRLIQKWLKAGVIEDGSWTVSDEGTPQGASVSPLLANVYLHYVLDLWAEQWRGRHAHGDVVIVRWADDFIVGFEHREDAERFLAELRERVRAVRAGAERRENTLDRVRTARRPRPAGAWPRTA
jgi:Reverse transcriptase (RNA-dependent DNA polymerase)